MQKTRMAFLNKSTHDVDGLHHQEKKAVEGVTWMNVLAVGCRCLSTAICVTQFSTFSKSQKISNRTFFKVWSFWSEVTTSGAECTSTFCKLLWKCKTSGIASRRLGSQSHPSTSPNRHLTVKSDKAGAAPQRWLSIDPAQDACMRTFHFMINCLRAGNEPPLHIGWTVFDALSSRNCSFGMLCNEPMQLMSATIDRKALQRDNAYETRGLSV